MGGVPGLGTVGICCCARTQQIVVVTAHLVQKRGVLGLYSSQPEGDQQRHDNGSQDDQPRCRMGEVQCPPVAEPEFLGNQQTAVLPIEVDRPGEPVAIIVVHILDVTSPGGRSGSTGPA